MPNSPARFKRGFRPIANADKFVRTRDSQRSIVRLANSATLAAQSSGATADSPPPQHSQQIYDASSYEAGSYE